MAARDLLQGGACNVNEGQSSAQMNQNPFMKAMDQIFTGNAQNKQMVQGFQNEQQGDIVQQQLQMQQQQLGMMNNEWNTLQKEFNEKAQINQQQKQMMEREFQKEAMAHQQFMQFQQMQMQNAWKQEQMNHQAQNWANEMQMNQAFDQAKQQVQDDQQKLQNVDKDEEQERIHSAANQLFEQMAQDEDPRFKNSKFLQFLGDLKTGEKKIVGKELIENPKQKEQELQQNLESAWEESKEQVHKDNLDMMTNAWQKAEQDEKLQEQNLEDFWAKRIKEYEMDQQETEKFQQQMEQEYQQVLKAMQNEQDLNEDVLGQAWGQAAQQEQQLIEKPSDHYDFKQNNPYLNHENPFQLGLEFMAQGKSLDAILAFEAQIQKDPKSQSNGNTWRIMGRLYQDNDQDGKAVSCLLNSLKFDENNLDTLLSLGISCTNILDQVKAMNFLKIWISKNPAYASLKFDQNVIPPEQLDNFTNDQVKLMNNNMINIFEQARAMNPNDPELLQSLAVLHFISSEYEKSVSLFQQALSVDQDNYSLWNKLGATLAHLGKSEEAMDAYHKALEIKPNYVRVWVNLGIAYAYKSEYDEASRFYLNALSFNPEADHIWTYLQTTFMCMQRFDLVGKLTQRDVSQFAQEFEILKPEELPQPEIPYGSSSANVVIKKGQIMK